MDVLEAPENLVEKVANVVITESLGLEQLVEVSLHQALDDVDVSQQVHGDGSQDVSDVYDVLVLESVQNLDFSQCSLTVGLKSFLC